MAVELDSRPDDVYPTTQRWGSGVRTELVCRGMCYPSIRAFWRSRPDAQVTYQTFHERLTEEGMEVEEALTAPQRYPRRVDVEAKIAAAAAAVPGPGEDGWHLAADDTYGVAPSQIREWFDYDPDTGSFTWTGAAPSTASRPDLIGKEAGGVCPATRRRRVKLMGRLYLVHRLVWAWMTGEWPASQMDHKDRDPLNQRWNNLRLASHAQNMQNRADRRPRQTGLRGVGQRGDRYTAKVHAGGKAVHLGCYATADEATAAVQAARGRLHGEFACHG